MIKISVAIIIGFASTALATRCHLCSSDEVEDCADPFKGGSRYEYDCGPLPKPLKAFGDLDPNFTVYESGCLKLKENSKGVEVLRRSCYFGVIKQANETCKRGSKLLQGNYNQISCDICTGDLCNSSTTTGAFTAIIMLFAILVRMMS